MSTQPLLKDTSVQSSGAAEKLEQPDLNHASNFAKNALAASSARRQSFARRDTGEFITAFLAVLSAWNLPPAEKEFLLVCAGLSAFTDFTDSNSVQRTSYQSIAESIWSKDLLDSLCEIERKHIDQNIKRRWQNIHKFQDKYLKTSILCFWPYRPGERESSEFKLPIVPIVFEIIQQARKSEEYQKRNSKKLKIVKQIAREKAAELCNVPLAELVKKRKSFDTTAATLFRQAQDYIDRSNRALALAQQAAKQQGWPEEKIRAMVRELAAAQVQNGAALFEATEEVAEHESPFTQEACRSEITEEASIPAGLGQESVTERSTAVVTEPSSTLQIEGSTQPEVTDLSAQILAATATVELFQAADCHYFHVLRLSRVSLEKQAKTISSEMLPAAALLEKLPELIRDSHEHQHNLIIRPYSNTDQNGQELQHEREDQIQVICIDDLSADKLSLISKHAFLTTETSPDSYQAHIAISGVTRQQAVEIKKQLDFTLCADSGANGSLRLPGSLNVKEKHLMAYGYYPTVRIIECSHGLLVTPSSLVAAGLLSPLPVINSFPSVPVVEQTVREQNTSLTFSDLCVAYDQALARAPQRANGNGSDSSRTDYHVAGLLWQRGVTEDQIVQLLLQKSPHVRRYTAAAAMKYAQRTVSNVVSNGRGRLRLRELTTTA